MKININNEEIEQVKCIRFLVLLLTMFDLERSY